MKLQDVKQVETITVKLRDPQSQIGEYLMEKGKPVTITLKGMHTDAFQGELTRQRAENARNEKRNIVKSVAQERADTARLYAAVTVSWAGVDGECTRENAEALYEPESSRWLVAQVSEALIELAQSVKK